MKVSKVRARRFARFLLYASSHFRLFRLLSSRLCGVAVAFVSRRSPVCERLGGRTVHTCVLCDPSFVPVPCGVGPFWFLPQGACSFVHRAPGDKHINGRVAVTRGWPRRLDAGLSGPRETSAQPASFGRRAMPDPPGMAPTISPKNTQ